MVYNSLWLVLCPKLTLAFLCLRVSPELSATSTAVASITVHTYLMIARTFPRSNSTLIYIWKAQDNGVTYMT